MTTPERHPARGPIRNRAGLGGGAPSPAAPPPSATPDASAAPPAAGSAQPSANKRERSLNESIASAVRHGYEVVEKNIEQGRKAAEQFRQGELSAKDATKNGREMMRRAFSLTRETAIAWFDIVDHVLDTSPRAKSEVESQKQESSWPPLYGDPPAFYRSPEPIAGASMPKLISNIAPRGRAIVLAARLNKTVRPLDPDPQLMLDDQLQARDDQGQPFAKPAPFRASFKVSPTRDTVVATITVNRSARPGKHEIAIWQVRPGTTVAVRIGEIEIQVKDEP